MKLAIVNIYDTSGKVVLTHIFYGKTISAAEKKIYVHMRYDTFFKDVIRDRYNEYQAFLKTDHGWVKVPYQMPKELQRVPFRLYQMPCCGFNLCWMNPRIPTYCPECGSLVVLKLRAHRECILLSDPDATLTYKHSL